MRKVCEKAICGMVILHREIDPGEARVMCVIEM